MNATTKSRRLCLINQCIFRIKVHYLCINYKNLNTSKTGSSLAYSYLFAFSFLFLKIHFYKKIFLIIA